jgi:hypothetical protein
VAHSRLLPLILKVCNVKGKKEGLNQYCPDRELV